MDDSNYQVLVQKVLSNDILFHAIREIEERTNALNLITESWEQTLENYSVYQVHKNGKAKYNKGHSCGAENKAFVKTIIPHDHIFNIIVAGEWYLQKPEKKREDFSFVVKNCEPLNKIGLIMREDEEKKLHTGARFFVNPCPQLLCHYCTTYHVNYKIPIPNKNWCILRLKIFNGKTIYNMYKTLLQPALSSLPSFMGIFRLEVLSRTSFGENSYKICGNIEEMIVFQKMNLNTQCCVTLPDPSLYSIEYPMELEPQENEAIMEE